MSTLRAVILVVVFLVVTTLVEQGSGDEICPQVCGLEPDGGPCLGRKRFRMWFYNAEAGECRKFSYGGCRGNKNRFWTVQECEGLCGKCRDDNGLQIETQEDLCQLPVDQGKCDGADTLPSIKWYFNSATGKAEPFAYTGCGGNANRFDSQQECEQICSESPADDIPS